MEKRKLIVFDVDGVLIDSYSGIPLFYEKLLPSMLNIDNEYSRFLLHMEYIADQAGLLREDWWSRYIPADEATLNELFIKYWEIRIETSRLEPGARHVLEQLRNKGWIVASVSYRDDIYGLKTWRIIESRLYDLFDDIIVVGEDASSRTEGIHILVKKYRPKITVYVDDKIQNLYRMQQRLENTIMVWYVFKNSWIGNLFWELIVPTRIYMVHNLYELVKILDNI